MAFLRMFTLFALLALAASVACAGALRSVNAPIVDPCQNVPCPPLTCPGGTLMKSYAGHCCPYCESQVVLQDKTDYSKAAAEAYATYKTAPYAGNR